MPKSNIRHPKYFSQLKARMQQYDQSEDRVSSLKDLKREGFDFSPMLNKYNLSEFLDVIGLKGKNGRLIADTLNIIGKDNVYNCVEDAKTFSRNFLDMSENVMVSYIDFFDDAKLKDLIKKGDDWYAIVDNAQDIDTGGRVSAGHAFYAPDVFVSMLANKLGVDHFKRVLNPNGSSSEHYNLEQLRKTLLSQQRGSLTIKLIDALIEIENSSNLDKNAKETIYKFSLFQSNDERGYRVEANTPAFKRS